MKKLTLEITQHTPKLVDYINSKTDSKVVVTENNVIISDYNEYNVEDYTFMNDNGYLVVYELKQMTLGEEAYHNLPAQIVPFFECDYVNDKFIAKSKVMFFRLYRMEIYKNCMEFFSVFVKY